MRNFCFHCHRASSVCVCDCLQPFLGPVATVFLVHPREARRPVASARLAHLSLKNSEYWIGTHFDAAMVADWIDEQGKQPFVLFPSSQSVAIDSVQGRQLVLHGKQEPVVFILDATWAMARKMLRENPFLQTMPHISFHSQRQSQFIVRKQPAANCLASIEAVDELFSALSPSYQQDFSPRLLAPFRQLVRTQIGVQKIVTTCDP